MTLHQFNDADYDDAVPGTGPTEADQDAWPLRYEDDIPTGPDSGLESLGGGEVGVPVPVAERSFPTESHKAVPVIQRAGNTHLTRQLTVNSPFPLVARRRGRRYLVLAVPATFTSSAGATSTPPGIQVADDRAALEVNLGYQLNPGDTLEIDSEGPIWVAPLPQAATGYVQYSESFDVVGGPPGQ